MASSTSLSVLVLITVMCCAFAAGFEFQVGGSAGWVVPPANQTDTYHEWASHNRFQVGDSIRFRYKKDSVMEVDEEGYKNCNSSHPDMFSNNGNTVIKLDHAGSFYFISGASGHCQKGQKLIVRVLNQEDGSLPDHHRHNSSSSSSSSAAAPFRRHVPPLLPNTVFFVSAFLMASYVI